MEQVAFRRILFPTDFSAATESALPYAAAFARRYDAELYLSHIIGPEHWHILPPDEVPHVLDRARRDAERHFSRLLNSQRLRGVRCEVVLARGPVRRVLPEIIEKRSIGLVVIGARARQGFRRLLLGSPAEEILEAARCPALIVGPGVRCENPELELREILFPTDFRSQAQAALPCALLLGQAPGTRLHLLHVLEEPPRDHLRDPEATERYLQQRLKDQIPADAHLACEPEYVVRFGPAVNAILACAEERHMDVIVLGKHQPGYRAVHLLGDTSYEIACRACCPVLAVCGPVASKGEIPQVA